MTRRAGREWRIAHTSDIQARGANAWSETLALACRQRVVPVARIDALEAVGPLAEALVAGGAAVIEVTLRTPMRCERSSCSPKTDACSSAPAPC